MRPCLLAALGLSCALSSTCATADKFAPRHPGDRCLEVCPEGMFCKRAASAAGADRTGPGECQLESGRCITQIDCDNRVARCVGASAADVGYCYFPLPMGP